MVKYVNIHNQLTKSVICNSGNKILGLIFIAMFIAVSAGCAHKPQSISIPTGKEGLLQLRQSYINTLRKHGVQVIRVGETVKLVFRSDLLFNPVSANINPYYRRTLNEAAKLIKTYETVTVKVAAYSDNVRYITDPRNHKQALTARQAQVIGKYLYAYGINARLVYAQGYGDKHPTAINATASGRSVNRRIEVSFRFYPKPFNNYK